MRSTTRSLAAVFTGAALTLAPIAGLASASAEPAPDAKWVWVCKYIQKPGEDEILKGGKNPIAVSVNAIDTDEPVQIGDFFKDGQELSYVIGFLENANDTYEGAPCPQTPPTDEPTTPPTTPPTDEPTTPPTDEPTTPPTGEPTTPPTTPPTGEPTTPGGHPTTNPPATGPVVETDVPGGGNAGQLALLAGGATLLAAGSALALNRRREDAQH